MGSGNVRCILRNLVKEPTGSSPLASYLREMAREINSNSISPGMGYRVRRGTTGTILEIGTPTGGGAEIEISVCDATTGTVKRYRITGTEVP